MLGRIIGLERLLNGSPCRFSVHVWGNFNGLTPNWKETPPSENPDFLRWEGNDGRGRGRKSGTNYYSIISKRPRLDVNVEIHEWDC